MRRLARFSAGRSWPSLVCLALLACAAPAERRAPPTAEPVPRFELHPTSSDRLPGWRVDDPREALAAFRRSCARLAQQDAALPMGPDPLFGQIGDWQAVCIEAAAFAGSSADQARAFIEDRFSPYLVADGANPEGLFTGYYEPLLNGSREFGGRYTVPLYRPPDDLLRIDLGRFNPAMRSTVASPAASSSPTTPAATSIPAPLPVAASSCSGSTIRSTSSFCRCRAPAGCASMTARSSGLATPVRTALPIGRSDATWSRSARSTSRT